MAHLTCCACWSTVRGHPLAGGVPLEAISDLARHKDSTVTRKIYRHVLADEIKTAAVAWDGPAEQTA